MRLLLRVKSLVCLVIVGVSVPVGFGLKGAAVQPNISDLGTGAAISQNRQPPPPPDNRSIMQKVIDTIKVLDNGGCGI